MLKLPYTNSKCNPVQAQQRIQKLLVQFGVDRISFTIDMKRGELVVSFTYQGYPVKLPVNYVALADRYIAEDPYTSRKRITEAAWIATKRDISTRAAYSILEDFLKGAITMVEMGVLPFEDVFIGSFVHTSGQRLGDMLTLNLPDFIHGRMALTEGEKNRG